MVPVDSTPQGAIVTYKGAAVGVTPCTIVMRNDSQWLRLSLTGHHDQGVYVGTVDNAGWILFGILLWGPFEVLIDAMSGAFSRTNDAPLCIPMTQDSSPVPPDWKRGHST